MKIIVIDASLYLSAIDQSEAHYAQASLYLTNLLNEHETKILVPEHFLVEVLSVSTKKGMTVDDALYLYDRLITLGLQSATLTREQWRKAENIKQEAEGEPSMYDLAYQVLAQAHKGTFVTLDQRHYRNASFAGSMILLDVACSVS